MTGRNNAALLPADKEQLESKPYALFKVQDLGVDDVYKITVGQSNAPWQSELLLLLQTKAHFNLASFPRETMSRWEKLEKLSG